MQQIEKLRQEEIQMGIIEIFRSRDKGNSTFSSFVTLDLFKGNNKVIKLKHKKIKLYNK